jgi:hypothetical protein
MTINDPQGVKGTVATGISGNDIVGYYLDASFHAHGFVYDGTTYTTFDDPLGTSESFAYGIQGPTIVGSYNVNDSEGTSYGFAYDYQPSATPEPATIVLAVAGFGALMTFARRCRSTG